MKRNFVTHWVFDGFDIFLTALSQLSVGILNRLANPVSINCNCGLTLKNKHEKTSRVFQWIVCFLFDAKKWMTSFYCRIFFVVVPRAASYLGLNRILKIFNTKWSYNKILIDWVRSGRRGKYFYVRTSLRSVRTSWRAKYFPLRPSHSLNKYIVICRLGGPYSEKLWPRS